MNTKLFKITAKSFFRRKKQVFNTCLTVFIVMIFVTFTAIFRDNMYNVQNELNKDHFGSWFIMEITNGKNNESLEMHKFLEVPLKSGTCTEFYNTNSVDIIGYMGYMSEQFIDSNNIKLRSGKWPEKANEIAIEYSALVEGGYNKDIGGIITVPYYKDTPINEENMVYKEFVLCGIIEDYTDEWYEGENMPRAVVTKELFDSFVERSKRNIYTYEIKKNIKFDDYYKFYQTLEAYSKNLKYNEYVYNYKPWGAEFVYNYLYISVMLVGMAVLVYKMLDYNAIRKDYYIKLNRLGASKRQISTIKNIENLILIVISGTLGILASILLGNAVAKIIETKLSLQFYDISNEVYIRSAIGIIAAIIAGVLSNIIFTIKEKRTRKNSKQRVFYSENETKMEKRRIGVKWSLLQFQKRISKSEGLFQKITVRLFLICVTFIIIGSFINIKNANKKFQNVVYDYDMVGYITPTPLYYYPFEFIYQFKLEEKDAKWNQLLEYTSNGEHKKYDNMEFEHMVFYDNDVLRQLSWGFKPGIQYGNYFLYDSSKWGWNSKSKYVLGGSDNINVGFSDSIINNINNVEGIKTIEYSVVETQRSWTWEGMNLDSMAYEKMADFGSQIKEIDENTKYLYATEYFVPTKELYEKLSKYIAPANRNYEEFCNGEQIIIFLNKNCEGKYDDTIKVGNTIRYSYYDPTSTTIDINNRVFNNIMKKYLSVAYWVAPDDVKEAFYYYEGISNIIDYGAAATPKIAAVIYIDDDNKGEFKDIISQNAYYNAIASKELAYKLNDAQNQIIRDITDNKYEQSYKEEYHLSVKDNYFRAKFSEEALFLATDNLISSYCSKAGLKVNNYYETNKTYSEQYFTSMLQNIVTIFLAVLINIVVIGLFSANRFRNRKARFVNLYKLGMSKKQLKQICMLESAREDIWCIVTMPIVLLIQYIYYHTKLSRL
ncbi:MAG: ABC transporter permease [Lachnospira sp.]|nr:ABC transporter permease [Lachnospira sp.]